MSPVNGKRGFLIKSSCVTCNLTLDFPMLLCKYLTHYILFFFSKRSRTPETRDPRNLHFVNVAVHFNNNVVCNGSHISSIDQIPAQSACVILSVCLCQSACVILRVGGGLTE